MPAKPLQYKQVGPTDPAEDILKLNVSPSKWRKADLDLLGVEYHYRGVDDIYIPDASMPQELRESKSLPLLCCWTDY